MPTGVLSKLNFGFRRAVVARNSVSFYSNSIESSSRRSFSANPMVASGSKVVFPDELLTSCGNGLDITKPSGVFFADRSRVSCVRASVRMGNTELPNNRLVSGCSTFDAMRRSSHANALVLVPLMRNIHSSSVCYSTGPAHDVSFDGNSREEQLDSNMISGQVLKLHSGSCYLPHPDKEQTGGEDAHFICDDEQAIGVADGVGGWADVGINAGEYARELMSNSVKAIQEESMDSIEPARVLEKAHSRTNANGSSTACIITLAKEGLHAINLGDSGFMVVRDGCTIFQSPVQQHGFNFTYQLASGHDGDPPGSGQVFNIPVAPGDVIIAGTDGLFDNLYNSEITAIVVQTVRAGLGPQVTAQKIAALARQRALDRSRQTPFSAAAQDAGYRYYGGKLDDVTVVVSYTTSSSNV
ncbi:hypothetical protein K2173_021256 [Erythroxylum novogranatense]|uniref:Protein phosphatase n=1 Tax=Erythroxylum novogranatense TaxID=1862640 RepID=A0AAV8TXK8_9ROSI|nr:hypothetical protein K2173_021256 [Erythroxylum novogranatense]